MSSHAPRWCAVVDRRTGEVLRFGYCDFERDGGFDGEREACRYDESAPRLSRRGNPFCQGSVSYWSNERWVTVSPHDKPQGNG